MSIFLKAVLLVLLSAGSAEAMHISEGILPFGWAMLWLAPALALTAAGIRQINILARKDLSFKPLVGLIAAVVFVISCMPVPVPTAGTCSHPCGTAISAILFGPTVSIAISGVALLIQALFLAHGGISTWGANVVSMGIAGSLTGWLVFKGMRSLGAGLGAAGFMAGLLADWATYFATSAELAAGIKGTEPFWPLMQKIMIAFIPTQLPLGLLEGAMTAGMVTLLYRKRPELLIGMGVLQAEEKS
jgi:cobalt/nickel transport system permease protein